MKKLNGILGRSTRAIVTKSLVSLMLPTFLAASLSTPADASASSKKIGSNTPKKKAAQSLGATPATDPKKDVVYYLNGNGAPREILLITTTNSNGFCFGGSSFEPIAGGFKSFKCFNYNGNGKTYDEILIEAPKSKKILALGECSYKSSFSVDELGDFFAEDTDETVMWLPAPNIPLNIKAISSISSRRLDTVGDQIMASERDFVEKEFRKHHKALVGEYAERGCKTLLSKNVDKRPIRNTVFVGVFTNNTKPCDDFQNTNYREIIETFEKTEGNPSCEKHASEKGTLFATCKSETNAFGFVASYDVKTCLEQVAKFRTAFLEGVKKQTIEKEKARLAAAEDEAKIKAAQTSLSAKAPPTQSDAPLEPDLTTKTTWPESDVKASPTTEPSAPTGSGT